MANMTGAFVLIIAVTAIAIIYLKMREGNKTKGYGWRTNVYIDMENGNNFGLQTDFNNPYDLIKKDPNTGKDYVRRNKGMMDKGDDMIFLGEDYWDSKARYDSWRLILKNPTKVIAGWVNDKLINIQRENINLKNELATARGRVIELENLMEEQFDQKWIPRHKAMKEAAQPIVLPKKTR